MREPFDNETAYERETSKMGLDTFPHNKDNVLDFPIDKLIETLKKQVKEAYAEHDSLIELEKTNPARFQELEEQANRADHSLHAQMYGYIEEVMYREDELFALFEMKIIYAFKHLEINIKQLLFAAYQDNYITRQFKWDSIIQFLHSKQINAKGLNEYDNINQLRIVNNSLKHAGNTTDQPIKNIPEFKNKDTFDYRNLESFYHRVNKSPDIFLTSLVSSVYDDIYTFNAERIDAIARSFAVRMDKKDAVELANVLLKFYE